MPTPSPLFTALFAPLFTALKSCIQQRHCPVISDSDWLQIGALRAIQDHSSGREFLQHLDANEDLAMNAPAIGHFFEFLKSQRRLELCAEVNPLITQAMTRELLGMIAHLYKMRWDIEKVFDDLKNKMGEKKAWASSLTAKSMQAQFLCIVHNLLKLLEHYLEKEHAIRNEAEIKRRKKRFKKMQATLCEKGHEVPLLVQMIQRITQAA